MEINFETFKAKRDDVDFSLCMSLPEHTWRVVRAGISLVERLSLKADDRAYWLPKVIRCAIWHDIGKIHPAFQKNLKVGNSKGSCIRHEIISLWMCEQCLALPDDELFAIATHHKGIIPIGAAIGKRLCEDDISNKGYLASLLKDASELLVHTPDIVQQWATLFGDETLQIKPSENFLQNTLSPKLLSYLKEKGQKDHLTDRLPFAMMRGLLMAADHLGSSLNESELPNFKPLYLTDFYATVKSKSGRKQRVPFRNFQEQMQLYKDNCVLHAPTGSGKTEAALSWIYANQTINSRLFYLLPFTASINAMVRRLENVYGNSRVTALHSKSLDFFYEEAIEECSNYEQSEERARAKQSASHEIFYPVKVATLHQVLKHALHGKGWDMTLFDYQNALFVVDEFHTYDAHLTGMMLATLKWLKQECNIRVMLMSATIPDFLLKVITCELLDGNEKKIIRPNPAKPSDAAILNRIRHKLICHERMTILDSLNVIENCLADEKQTTLVIVNNVRSCQILGEKLARYNPVLLHGGFNREDRREKENKITNEDKAKQPRLLIATQAIEVSLDIDYGVAFIENAPIDAIIQRFGRVNRSGKRKEPSIIHLFENSIGNISKVYPYRVTDTWNAMLELHGKELSEQTLMEVCNRVYKDGYSQEEMDNFQMGFQHEQINQFREKIFAGHWQEWIEDVIEASSQKIEVLCYNLFSKYVKLKEDGRFIEASQLLVQTYPWVVPSDERSKTDPTKHGVWVGQRLRYSSEIGFVRESNSAGVFDDDF